MSGERADEACFGEYRFEDRSLLLRVIKGPVLEPIVRALPLWVTPNWVTVAGHLAAWVALGALFLVPKTTPALFLLLAVNSLAYILFDCLDGMLARHQRRTSSLGELLDHYLDGLSVPVVAVTACYAFDLPGWMALATIGSVVLTHYTVFLHGYRVGHVLLGEIGIIEGGVLSAAVYAVAALVGAEVFTAPRLFGVSIAGGLTLATVFGGLGAVVPMRRLLRRPGDFAPMLLTIALGSVWYAFGALPWRIAALLLLLTGAELVGGVTLARLMRRPLARWDGVVRLALGAATFASLAFRLDARAQTTAALLVMAVALVRGGADFFRAVFALSAPPPAPAAAVVRPD